jgi:ribosome-associated translation inhibitor RaiA
MRDSRAAAPAGRRAGKFRAALSRAEEVLPMQIQVNADRTINTTAALTEAIQASVHGALRRFEDAITRVEVHLSDVNAHKGGSDDKRCVLEARPSGMKPVVVTHHAATVMLAVEGATDKLVRVVDTALERRRAH